MRQWPSTSQHFSPNRPFDQTVLATRILKLMTTNLTDMDSKRPVVKEIPGLSAYLVRGMHEKGYRSAGEGERIPGDTCDCVGSC